jgi:hypothetical protein
MRAEKEKEMSRRNVHVVPKAGGWAVRREGAERASTVTRTQQQAIDRARQIARREHGELVVQGENGRIRAKDSHGRDQSPPKG